MRFIDVSSDNQHPIDWEAVRNDGIDGVMCKATEGTGYVNPDFGLDYNTAKAAGLTVGAYHFWHPDLDLEAQLAAFKAHYGRADGDLPPAWDAEVLPAGFTWQSIAHQLAIVAWDLTSHYGDLWLYVDRSWEIALRPYGFPFGRGTWLATGTAMERRAALQFAPTSVAGISGPVDWSVR